MNQNSQTFFRKISIKNIDSSPSENIHDAQKQKQLKKQKNMEILKRIFIQTMPQQITKSSSGNNKLDSVQTKILLTIIEIIDILKNKPQQLNFQKEQTTLIKTINYDKNSSKKSKFQKVNKNIKQQKSGNKNLKSSNNSIFQLFGLGNKLNTLCQSFFSQYKKNQLQNKDESFIINKIEILIKGYCLLICLNIYLLNYSVEYQILQLAQFQHTIQLIKQFIATHHKNIDTNPNKPNPTIPSLSIFPSQLLSYTLAQLFSLTTLTQYSLYNIKTNQQFKYDQDTQIQFLFILSIIKLSQHLDILKKYANYQLQPKNMLYELKQLKFKKTIFEQGKDLIKKCGKLVNNRKNINDLLKITLIKQKIQLIQHYIQWIQNKWVNKIKTTLGQDLQQMPVQYLFIYELFYLIYNFGLIQKQIKSKNNLSKDIISTPKSILLENKNKNEQIILLKQKLHKILINQKKKQFQNQFSNSSSISKKSIENNNSNISQALIIIESVIMMMENYFNQNDQNKKILYLQINNIIKSVSFKFILQKIREYPQINNFYEKQKNEYFNTQKFLKENSEKSIKKLLQVSNSEQKNQLNQPKIVKQNKIKTNNKQTLMSNEKSNLQKQNLQKLETTSNLAKSPLDKKILTVCKTGQYLTKFNFGNSSYSIKFVKISSKGDKILWGDSQYDIQNQEDASSYKFQKISGLVFGNITSKTIYHCQKSRSKKQPILPSQCFSLICDDRTLDFYCYVNQYDVFFWLQGISSLLQTKYKKNINFSRGKILWKKILLKIKYLYLPIKTTKTKQRFYMGRDNAKAIIQFGKLLKNNKKV